ncbi:MAG: hypothetical protein JWM40_2957 [Frankiales bacterium]|nr:hypothetical protein [Frankiales bacterium]
MTQDQLALLELHEIVLPEHPEGATLEQQFQAFHTANTWVYDALVTLTAEYVTGGATRVSINMLTEVLRYRRGVTQGDTYKLNNSYRAFYARLIMQNHPEWDGLFETRRQRAA